MCKIHHIKSSKIKFQGGKFNYYYHCILTYHLKNTLIFTFSNSQKTQYKSEVLGKESCLKLLHAVKNDRLSAAPLKKLVVLLIPSYKSTSTYFKY